MKRGFVCVILIGVLCSALMITGCHKRAPEPEPIPPTPIPEPTPEPTPVPVPTQSPEEIRMLKLTEARSFLSETDIYFDFDKAMLTDAAKTALAKKAEYLVSNSDIKVTIEGHCDERGANEYNLGLGESRASAAKKYLVAFGVLGDNISTVTFGEEKPVCFESNESCWSQNRRAHFEVID
jgi:peptidoglycan-associated lipoprotein